MGYNALFHSEKFTIEFLTTIDFECKKPPTPPCSSDLKPIEIVWGKSQRRICYLETNFDRKKELRDSNMSCIELTLLTHAQSKIK